MIATYLDRIAARYDASAWFRVAFGLGAMAIGQTGVFVLIKWLGDGHLTGALAVAWLVAVSVFAVNCIVRPKP